MKKLYTLLAAATFATSAFALQPVAKEAVAYPKTPSAKQLVMKDYNYSPDAVSVSRATPAIPASGWTALGTGKYAAGLLTVFPTIVEEGQQWNVTIEECTEGGEHWYRFIPFNENSPIPEKLGAVDDQYLYVNVTNPNKVWTADFGALQGMFPIVQWCPESATVADMLAKQGVTEDQYDELGFSYGTLTEGLVQFPTASHLIYLTTDYGVSQNGFYDTNQTGTLAFATPGVEIPVLWETLGEGVFYNGITGSLLENQEAVETDVVIQKSTKVADWYRVLYPWTPFGGTQPLILDCTDARCVMIYQQETGVSVGNYGPLTILCYAANFVHDGEGGMTVDQFLAGSDNKGVANSTRAITYKDGVVTIPGTGIFYYYPEYDAEHVYSVTDPLDSKIVFPTAGVEQVAVSDENAPVEYYNLQGVRVANPENGLYIRRQGNKATKVLVK